MTRKRLPFHCIFLRSAQRLAACTPTLQAIISGTASIGGNACSRMAPATAENAKPARPETSAPEKAAALSRKQDAMSVMILGLSVIVSSIHRRAHGDQAISCGDDLLGGRRESHNPHQQISFLVGSRHPNGRWDLRE